MKGVLKTQKILPSFAFLRIVKLDLGIDGNFLASFTSFVISH